MVKKVTHKAFFKDVKIDTVLNGRNYSIGDCITGEVQIYGGQKEYQLGYVYMYLKTHYLVNPSEPLVKTETFLETYEICRLDRIEPGEHKSIPFEIRIPFHTPITHRSSTVAVFTGLDVHAADDPEDTDYIEVGPAPIHQLFLEAIENEGFTHRRRACFASLVTAQQYEQIFYYERPGDHVGKEEQLEFTFNQQEEHELFVNAQLTLDGNTKRFTIIVKQDDTVKNLQTQIFDHISGGAILG